MEIPIQSFSGRCRFSNSRSTLQCEQLLNDRFIRFRIAVHRARLNFSKCARALCATPLHRPRPRSRPRSHTISYFMNVRLLYDCLIFHLPARSLNSFWSFDSQYPPRLLREILKGEGLGHGIRLYSMTEKPQPVCTRLWCHKVEPPSGNFRRSECQNLPPEQVS